MLKILGGLIINYNGEVKILDKERKFFDNNCVNVSYSEQNPYIFTKSLAFNIALNKNIDSSKMSNAIKQAKLEQFVQSLPNGLNTIIDEENAQVSGGEKLRISLARAFYLDKPIMLLDEITASLDKNLSEEIDNVISTLEGKLIINISHKYNKESCQKYDKILVMKNGNLQEVRI